MTRRPPTVRRPTPIASSIKKTVRLSPWPDITAQRTRSGVVRQWLRKQQRIANAQALSISKIQGVEEEAETDGAAPAQAATIADPGNDAGPVKDVKSDAEPIDKLPKEDSGEENDGQDTTVTIGQEKEDVSKTTEKEETDKKDEKPISATGGLRARLRRLFGRDEQSSEGKDEESTREKKFRPYSLLKRRKSRAAEQAPNTSVVGNSALNNSLNLMIATNTPLPASSMPTPANPVAGFPTQGKTSYSSLGAAVKAAGDREV